MNIFRKPVSIIKPAFLGLLYGVFATTPAVAEDIEIYTGSISSASSFVAASNVLFIVDTSGSMSSLVTTLGDYDPATIYPASCFNANTIYVNVKLDGAGPNGYCTGAYNLSSLAKFNADPAVFVCKDGRDKIAATGFVTGDRVAQFRDVTTSTGGRRRGTTTTVTKWTSISSNVSNFDKMVECKADNGIDGKGGPETYATDSTASGFTTTSSQVINWNSQSSASLYGANYLNFLVAEPPISKTRLRVMQDALTDLVNTTSGINIGLMRFDTNANGGMVVTPMGPIDTTKPAFIAELEDMYYQGGTPLSESFYEAALYYQGKNVDYGDSSVAGYASPTPDTAKLSHPDSRTPSGGSKYKTPITSECQKNYIVLLTDGAPTSDTGITGAGSRTDIGLTSACVGNCLDEIAYAIGSQDQNTDIDGDQVISTFTIGLELDDPLLKATAQASFNATKQGKYFIAGNAAELTSALTEAVRKVLDTDATFSSPAVSVNAFNRSTHLNDLYFTLFKPSATSHWEGNFKKYKLLTKVDVDDIDGDGDVTDTVPYIADADYKDAIDIKEGFFANLTRSFWTPVGFADGPLVTAGGSVENLTNTRKVYTYPNTYNNASGVFTPSSAAVGDLTNVSNLLDKSNALITDVMLNTVAVAPYTTLPAVIPYRDTLLDWAKGLDIRDSNGDGDITDARLEMGDPLHAQPALVQYGQLATDSDGDGVKDPDLVGYVATNDGYLHAIDSISGQEKWAFVPQELLPNLTTNFENDGSFSKSYGLDGDVVAWINDIDENGAINGADTVYLYIGMRRGGRNIYSLDVTNPDIPKLRWIINGGTGDYAEMGETWSSVNVEKMNISGTEKTVLIFGGGYDDDQDVVTVRTPDAVGRAIYIVDAETGARLWSAGPSGTGETLTLGDMQYSIPARVKPLDVNSDGFIDRLYAADMGGQIFRFDITAGATLSTITGGRIADLAEDASVTGARRFYYPPDVALIVEEGQAPYISIVAASGWRAHPLDEIVEDKIYMLRENAIYSAPKVAGSVSYTTVVEADLFDTTTNAIGETTGVAQATLITSLGSSKGWYIDLDDGAGVFAGEKGLSEPLILGGVAIVTTYLPENIVPVDPADATCAPQAGTGVIYYLNVTDGTPAVDIAGYVPVRADRQQYLKRSGIPPSPSVIITEGGIPTVCVGTECGASEGGLSLQKMYWYEVEQ